MLCKSFVFHYFSYFDTQVVMKVKDEGKIIASSFFCGLYQLGILVTYFKSQCQNTCTRPKIMILD